MFLEFLGHVEALLWFSMQLVWLLLVITAGNQMGYFPWWKVPVSVRYLGPNKTRDAYIAGPLFAACASTLLWDIEPMLSAHFGVNTFWDALRVGAVVGLGVVLGDHGNSRLKRIRRITVGDSWLLDRIDWAIGGGMAAYFFVPNVELVHVVALIDIAAPLHVYFNRNSYKRGWRKTEH